MHVLVINDDGPPSAAHSPYVFALVEALRAAGHGVSVCLPHVQRSWIGKAHFIGDRVTPTYYRPGSGPIGEGGTTHEHPGPVTGLASIPSGRSTTTDENADEWVLIDGTPATCAQLGLHHLFAHRSPIDLVLSGPNFGRNTTALYSLSSGTLGGALEAAACHVKAVALSFAYDRPRNEDPVVIAAATRHSVRVVEHLLSNWGEGVDLYSVNVPVRPNVENEKVMVTFMVQNRWATGESSFKPVETPGRVEGNVVEEKDKPLEDKAGREGQGEGNERKKPTSYTHRYYEWGPSHQSVRKTVEDSAEGSDGRALVEGWTSVTPLKAAFWEVTTAHPLGEMKLLLAHIAYDDAYVQPLILAALAHHLAPHAYTLLPAPLSTDAIAALPVPYLHIAPYEALAYEALLLHPRTYLANAYTIRKALIRKHNLAATISGYAAKHPNDSLATHWPLTLPFEVDYAEFLDDALLECYELHEAWERNADKAPKDREWWILKPGMSDRGQGIRLFSSKAELQEIFEAWEAANPESDEEEDDNQTTKDGERATEPGSLPSGDGTTDDDPSSGLMASQLRHFVVQPYISPLLLPAGTPFADRKFHLRSYVLAVGALRVFVHDTPLALFAPTAYVAPGTTVPDGDDAADAEGIDMRPHLTNTCLQASSAFPSPHLHPVDTSLHATNPPSPPRTHDGPLCPLPTLPLPPALLSAIQSTLRTCTGALFRAAAATPAHFQPLPNAFELFGVDWLVDADGKAWLLEVNAFPDFGQSGDVGREVVEGVWRGAVGRVLDARGLGAGKAARDGWIEVLDMDLGRG